MSKSPTDFLGRSRAFDKPGEHRKKPEGVSPTDGPGAIPARSVSGQLCSAKCRGRTTVQRRFSGVADRRADAPDPLSLSMSHNSDGTSELTQSDLPFHLTGSQAKTAYALRYNAERMIAEAGIECVGFLTLTVGNQGERSQFTQVWDSNEASRRINNLNRRVLSTLFERAIVVTERHKNGAIHFHILGVLRGRPDIRMGFDWQKVAERDYSGVSAQLRAIWTMLRETLPAYGFGRAELTPIKKTGEAVAAYVSKYVEKNLFNRLACDRRKKLVRYIGFERRQLKPNEFSWASPRATSWRIKTRQLAAIVGIGAREQMGPIFGPRWAFKVSRVMNAIQDDMARGFDWSWQEMQAARLLMLREGNRRKLVEANERRIGGDSEAKFLRAIGAVKQERELTL